MNDKIGDAAEELRVYIVSNGYSEDILKDISQDHGIQSDVILNRFKRMFGKLPSEIEQGPAIKVVPSSVVRQKALKWSYMRVFNEKEQALVGRKFFHRGEPYIYAGLWMNFGWAFKLSNGRLWRFDRRLYAQIVAPQLHSASIKNSN